jgi:hypothetical protein
MATPLTVNLNFIPKDLDGNPLLGDTLAKVVGRLMCEGTDNAYCLAKYQFGVTLFTTGQVQFADITDPATAAIIAYFQGYIEAYAGFSNQVKGQILALIPGSL